MTWRDATRCAGLALRGVLPWRGVRRPGLAWLPWRGVRRPGLAWLPSVARRPGLAWLPSVARCPGWRDRPALHVGPAGVVAQRGALSRLA